MTMIYVLALGLTQIVTGYQSRASVTAESTDAFNLKQLQMFYGSVDKSVLSMYMMIADGIHWHELLTPLMKISPLFQVLFYMISAFAVFAMLNCVTGVFVDICFQAAREDHHKAICVQIHKLFAV